MLLASPNEGAHEKCLGLTLASKYRIVHRVHGDILGAPGKCAPEVGTPDARCIHLRGTTGGRALEIWVRLTDLGLAALRRQQRQQQRQQQR
jgi:hypothetical protein